MLTGKKIGFIGGGQMAEAIFSGALAAGALVPGQVTVSDILLERLGQLEERYGIATLPNTAQNDGAKKLAAESDVVILAIKPQLARDILTAAAPGFKKRQPVISIIGGLTLETLRGLLPGCHIIRTMPNTPMLVRRGSAVICPADDVSEEELALCRQLFDAVGSSYEVPERLINPFTAVGGCGPAYAYLFAEALADGGVAQGLPRAMAMHCAAEMLAGAAEMMLQTGQHPAALKDTVCSPGGGTIMGVQALEENAFRGTVMKAVEAARQRMDELA